VEAPEEVPGLTPLGVVIPLADLVMRHVHSLVELQMKQFSPAMQAHAAAISTLADRLAHVEKGKADAEARFNEATARRLEVEAQSAIAAAEAESDSGGAVEMIGQLIPLVAAQQGRIAS
jgi:hypothetical protein